MRLIHIETEKALNELLRATFQSNSHADNCAYNLAFLVMPKAEKIYHETYAHKFPEWADMISDCVISLGGVPVRQALEANIERYENIEDIFEETQDNLLVYRDKIYEAIETADIHNNREVVCFLDDLLKILTPYLKQVDIWATKAKRVNRLDKFDEDFGDFTFI
jgi:bacterioferritin (cytochrome b1)